MAGKKGENGWMTNENPLNNHPDGKGYGEKWDLKNSIG